MEYLIYLIILSEIKLAISRYLCDVGSRVIQLELSIGCGFLKGVK